MSFYFEESKKKQRGPHVGSDDAGRHTFPPFEIWVWAGWYLEAFLQFVLARL